jgi:ENTS family enterobactin (siderophore) exporter
VHVGVLFAGTKETLWIAFPLVFLATALSSLFNPAMNSVLPAVVGDEEDLVKANGIWSQMDALSFVLGPALGGALVLLGEPRLAFLINGLTFFVSAATLLFVRIPPREAAERPEEGEGSWFSETLAGFRFLFRENEGALAAFTLTITGIGLMGGAMWTLTVVLAEETFDLGGQGAGFLNAAYGAGGLLGGLLVGAIAPRLGLGSAFIWGTAISSVVAILFGLSPAGVLPFVLILALGVSDVFSDVASTTVLQTGTPDELLGRVFGAFESTLIFSMLVGSVVIGPLIDLAGPRAATVILTLVSVVLLIVCLPRLRRMEDALGVRVFFRQVPVLASLPHRVIDDFASLMRLEKVPAGTDIVR